MFPGDKDSPAGFFLVLLYRYCGFSEFSAAI